MDTSITDYVRTEVRGIGVAEFSRLAIEAGENALRDGRRSELEQFISVYTELLYYRGAPVNNLRHERRRMADALLQVSRAPEPAWSIPLRDGIL